MKKKSLVIIVVIVCLVFFVGVMVYRGKNKSPNAVYKDKFTYTVKWDGENYTGTYEGEYTNSKPFGYGVFHGEDFRYEGEWKNGKFSGEGEITYKDGTVECGEFNKGKRNGICKVYSEESSYVETRYQNNVPFGNCYTYENNKIKNIDMYSAGELVSNIEKDAVLLEGKKIKDQSYSEQYIYIVGTVEFVGMDDEKCYFRIKSDSVGMVIGSYENTYGISAEQVIMPNMKNGDTVKVYGYYKGFTENKCISDNNGFGYDYMTIQPLYGKVTQEEEIDVLDMDYQTRVNNPYLNYYDACEDVFVVENSYRDGKRFYIKASRKETNSKNEKETFYLLYKGNWEDVFIEGQKIRILGYYEGQYRELSNTTEYQNQQEDKNNDYVGTYRYDIYPAIRIIEIQ